MMQSKYSEQDVYFEKGLKNLSRHNLDGALVEFRNALEDCPSGNSIRMDRILFYTGMTYCKMGLNDTALEIWKTGAALRTRSLCREQLEREMNPYGMPRQDSTEADDREAFISVQLERYLKRKKQHRFCSLAERDVIRQIIEDSWEEFRSDPYLSQKDTDEKISSFYRYVVVFPYFIATEESVVSVDFTVKRKISGHETCSCGSGLSYHHCCGRIPTAGELVNGPF